MFVGWRSLSVNVSGRSSLDCGYQVPSKLFAASLTHTSFGWQTGELFGRTRRDINLDNSPSVGLAVGQQSGGAAVIPSAVRGYRPAPTYHLLPALS
jgi:hypothetical protein